MSKLLTTLLAAAFAAAVVTPVAFAQPTDAAQALAAACKGKKPGDAVIVNGKGEKCPKPQAEKKK